MHGQAAPRGGGRPLQTILAGVLLTVCAAMLAGGAPEESESGTPLGMLSGARPPSVARHLLFSTDHCAKRVMQDYGCSEAGCEDVQQNGGGWVNYIMAQECTMHGAKWLGWIFLACWLCFLLYLLGDTADALFCPALDVIVEQLRMSPNLAGVTFLAFGNGAPDAAASLAAFISGSGQVGIAAILGAGVFVTTVVVGAVGLVSPPDSRLDRRPFFRDVGFYILAVLYLLFVFLDDHVTLVEALGFNVLYAIFAAVVVIGRRIYQSRKRARLAAAESDSLAAPLIPSPVEKSSAQGAGGDSDGQRVSASGGAGPRSDDSGSRKEGSDEGSDGGEGEGEGAEGEGGEQADGAAQGGDRTARSISDVEYGKEDRARAHRGRTKRLVRQRSGSDSLISPSPHTYARGGEGTAGRGPHAAQHSHHFLSPGGSTFFERHTRHLHRLFARLERGEAGVRLENAALALAARQAQLRAAHEEEEGQGSSSSGSVSEAKGAHVHPSPWVHPSLRPRSNSSLSHRAKRSWAPAESGDQMVAMVDALGEEEARHEDLAVSQAATYCPYRLSPVLKSAMELALMPSTVVRLISVPVVTEEDYDWRVCALTPTFGLVFVVFVAINTVGGDPPALLRGIGAHHGPTFSPLTVSLAVGLLTTALCLWRLPRRAPPRGVPLVLFTLLAFISSVCWIIVIANETVSLLESLGRLIHVSPTILGLTVLAWGNSLGDLVADVSVARGGEPKMAIAATYAGPLFNLLIGLCLSLTVGTLKSHGGLHLQTGNPTTKATVITCFIFLLVSLTMSIVVIPLSGFRITRLYGGVLVLLYITFLSTSIYVQF